MCSLVGLIPIQTHPITDASSFHPILEHWSVSKLLFRRFILGHVINLISQLDKSSPNPSGRSDVWSNNFTIRGIVKYH